MPPAQSRCHAGAHGPDRVAEVSALFARLLTNCRLGSRANVRAHCAASPCRRRPPFEYSSEMPYRLEHRTTKTVTTGAHYPLGATLTPTGVNFALYSQHATEVFLLLFD